MKSHRREGNRTRWIFSSEKDNEKSDTEHVISVTCGANTSHRNGYRMYLDGPHCK